MLDLIGTLVVSGIIVTTMCLIGYRVLQGVAICALAFDSFTGTG